MQKKVTKCCGVDFKVLVIPQSEHVHYECTKCKREIIVGGSDVSKPQELVFSESGDMYMQEDPFKNVPVKTLNVEASLVGESLEEMGDLLKRLEEDEEIKRIPYRVKSPLRRVLVKVIKSLNSLVEQGKLVA